MINDLGTTVQVARLLLIAQMIFNIVVLTRAAHVLLASRAVRHQAE